jgi:type II secretion system protein H
LSRLRTSAFTIIELLMAIALMGLMAALALGPGRAVFARQTYEPLSETLRRSVREARFQSVASGRPVALEWDSATYSFVIRDADGAEIERIKSEAGTESDDVLFHAVLPWEQVEVPGKDPLLTIIAQVRFDPDRSSTPFVASIHYAGEDTELRYDPFSNLRMESPPQ